MNTTNVKQKQTFTFRSPAATSVLLVGDFTRWQQNPIPLQKQPNGVWTTTALLEPGTYHYRFLVDGEWCDDPNCTLRVPNPFGTQDSVLMVAAAEAAKGTGTRPAQGALRA
jgi:1,4-alpha-glucan branching enzyme